MALDEMSCLEESSRDPGGTAGKIMAEVEASSTCASRWSLDYKLPSTLYMGTVYFVRDPSTTTCFAIVDMMLSQSAEDGHCW